MFAKRGSKGSGDADAAREMERIPFYIDETGGISIAQLVARARRKVDVEQRVRRKVWKAGQMLEQRREHIHLFAQPLHVGAVIAAKSRDWMIWVCAA